MMKALSARDLELYRQKGDGVVARKINAAVKQVAKDIIKACGRNYSQEKAVKAFLESNRTTLSPLLWEEREFGAADSEPIRACRWRIAKLVGKCYNLDEYDVIDLYDEIH